MATSIRTRSSTKKTLSESKVASVTEEVKGGNSSGRDKVVNHNKNKTTKRGTTATADSNDEAKADNVPNEARSPIENNGDSPIEDLKSTINEVFWSKINNHVEELLNSMDKDIPSSSASESRIPVQSSVSSTVKLKGGSKLTREQNALVKAAQKGSHRRSMLEISSPEIDDNLISVFRRGMHCTDACVIRVRDTSGVFRQSHLNRTIPMVCIDREMLQDTVDSLPPGTFLRILRMQNDASVDVFKMCNVSAKRSVIKGGDILRTLAVSEVREKFDFEEQAMDKETRKVMYNKFTNMQRLDRGIGSRLKWQFMEKHGIEETDTIATLEEKASVSFSIFGEDGYLSYESKKYRNKHVSMIRDERGLYYFIPRKMLGAFGSQWNRRYRYINKYRPMKKQENADTPGGAASNAVLSEKAGAESKSTPIPTRVVRPNSCFEYPRTDGEVSEDYHFTPVTEIPKISNDIPASELGDSSSTGGGKQAVREEESPAICTEKGRIPYRYYANKDPGSQNTFTPSPQKKSSPLKPIREQPIQEQPIREQPSRDQLVREQAIREQASREQAGQDQPIQKQGDLKQHILQHASRDQFVREQASREQASREQAGQPIREQGVREQGIRENVPTVVGATVKSSPVRKVIQRRVICKIRDETKPLTTYTRVNPTGSDRMTVRPVVLSNARVTPIRGPHRRVAATGKMICHSSVTPTFRSKASLVQEPAIDMSYGTIAAVSRDSIPTVRLIPVSGANNSGVNSSCSSSGVNVATKRSPSSDTSPRKQVKSVSLISKNHILTQGEVLLTTKDHIIFRIPRSKGLDMGVGETKENT